MSVDSDWGAGSGCDVSDWAAVVAWMRAAIVGMRDAATDLRWVRDTTVAAFVSQMHSNPHRADINDADKIFCDFFICVRAP